MQHPAGLADKRHLVLIGMKVEIPDWPGGHLPIIHRPGTAVAASTSVRHAHDHELTARSPSDAGSDGRDHLARQPFGLLIVGRPVGSQAQRGEAELDEADQLLGHGFRGPATTNGDVPAGSPTRTCM